MASLRRQCLIMAQNNHTPVGFWLGCTLAELRRWVDVNNEIVESMQRKK